jgi:hypothetical protein
VTIAVHNQKARITLKQPDVIHLPKIVADLAQLQEVFMNLTFTLSTAALQVHSTGVSRSA